MAGVTGGLRALFRLRPVLGGSLRHTWRGLDEFKPIVADEKEGADPKASPHVGRAWKASEMRLKSFDDLHKLWYVLIKERNALKTEKMFARRKGQHMEAPARFGKVKQSMARLKTVLGERERAGLLGEVGMVNMPWGPHNKLLRVKAHKPEKSKYRGMPKKYGGVKTPRDSRFYEWKRSGFKTRFAYNPHGKGKIWQGKAKSYAVEG